LLESPLADSLVAVADTILEFVGLILLLIRVETFSLRSLLFLGAIHSFVAVLCSIALLVGSLNSSHLRGLGRAFVGAEVLSVASCLLTDAG
jgi:hypothetical protein